MPKKTAAARGGAQRNKAKAQKSFELVRPVTSASPVSDEQDLEMSSDVELESETSGDVELETVSASVSTVTAPTETKKTEARQTEVKQKDAKQTEGKPREKSVPAPATSAVATPGSTAPKGSAAARLVARRQAAQKSQQRAAATLITSEHYAYVRKDLIFIAILAAIMFAVIIGLQFVPGI